MAVTGITISQDNLTGPVNLLSVHNPLVFLVDVEYTSSVPTALYVEIQNSDAEVLGTFSAIPYSDSDSGNTRTFAFVATDILKAYMDDIDDFESPILVIDFVENITKEFTLRFYIGAIEDSIDIVACHAVRQFGENPAMESIYNNDDDTYYAGDDHPVYVYFYNNNENNVITVDTPVIDQNYALDYDDDVFMDENGTLFTIL